jgi:hypothetical protein
MHRTINSMLSDGFADALWDTLIPLATAAGICVSVISLADHLNETRGVRPAGDASASSASMAGVDVAPSTSNLN